MTIAILETEKTPSVPEFLDLSTERDQKRISELRSNGVHVIDQYAVQLEELFQVDHPDQIFSHEFSEKCASHIDTLKEKTPLWQQGVWVYYPWRSTMVHVLEEESFFKVRTARNKNLITESEQKKFYDAVVGIAGLSVGNSVALALVVQGGAKHIKLADLDTLELSNTNRIRTGIHNLGLAKVEATAREIYEINPYAQVELFSEGLTKENIDAFYQGLDIAIDEMDNIAMKVRMREYAKKYKLPLVSAADVADNGVVYVERYDKNENQKFFHGYIGDVTAGQVEGLDKLETGKTIAQMVGLENHTEAMLDSLTAIGQTIVSWPQLAGAAFLNSAAVAYCVRKIVNDQPLAGEDGRIVVSLDEKLIPDYSQESYRAKQKRVIENFKKILNL